MASFRWRSFFLVLALARLAPEAVAQHQHVNAGALSTVPGSKLYFANGDSFVTNSGYVFSSVLRTNGPASGLYDAAITFTALARDSLNGGPEPGHAGDGAQLALVVKSLSGPEGSSWAFWESLECDDFGESITFSLLSGETNSTNHFLLSQNSGLPGEDPYGHCHGRRYTMSKSGLHIVGVQIVDVSHNGPGGGPVHIPSDVYHFYFQAGITLVRLERKTNEVVATFATRAGSSYYLETKPVLDNAEAWTTVAGPVSGNNRLHALTDTTVNAADLQRFYHLRVTTP